MDIIKLRNDYLKKINKSASELNRRLEFLNEINNTISHNNMIGGAGDNLIRPAQPAAAAVNVDEIITRNNLTVEEIKKEIIRMKAIHSQTLTRVTTLEATNSAANMSINLLNDQISKLKSSAATLSSSQDNNKAQIAQLQTENKKYMESINKLTSFVNSSVEGIQSEIRK